MTTNFVRMGPILRLSIQPRTLKPMNKLPAMLLMTLALAGCQSVTGSPAPNSPLLSSARFCVVYDPVYTAKADTEITKQQVDANNAKWVRLCDKKGKAK